MRDSNALRLREDQLNQGATREIKSGFATQGGAAIGFFTADLEENKAGVRLSKLMLEQLAEPLEQLCNN